MEWGFVGRERELQALGAAVDAGTSVLLTGAAGVGKSRLADEFSATLSRGHHLERLIGSPSIRELPFGGVAHLAADAPLPEPSMLITFVARVLEKRAGSKSLVIIVDDIDLLDDGSIALVHQLLRDNGAVIVATARDEGVGEPRVLPLWKDGLLRRIDIEPLSRDETERLACEILGGSCTAELHNEVWRLSEGHPLFVREVLLEALEQGSVTRHGGVIGLSRSLSSSRRLSDLVRSRTEDLDDDELAGLRVVALSEPLRLDIAKRLVSPVRLESLEVKGMLRLEPTSDGPLLRTAHPLIAEVTVDLMPGLSRAAATARLAEALIADSPLTPNDAMRASIWLLDAGETPHRDVAIIGARAALKSFDPALARRLAEAALSRGESQEALVLLGRAHAASGESAEAVALLHDAQHASTNEAELVAATVALAEVHMFTLGEVPVAVRELKQTLDALQEPGPRAELSSHLVLAAGLIGDFDLGLRIGPEVVDRVDLPEPAQLRSVMAMTLTQTMTGRLDHVIERLDRGDALAGRHSDVQPFAPDQIGMNRVLALHAADDLLGAERFARQSIRRGVGLPGPWLFVSSISRQYTGDIDAALRLTGEAQRHLEEIDPLGLKPMAEGIHGLYAAMSGDVSTAETLIGAVQSDPRRGSPRVAVWMDRTLAWVEATTGDTRSAAALAEQAGRHAIAGTHYVWGAYALHDAVRFGHAAAVVDSLARLQAENRGPLVDLLSDHAFAIAGEELTALERVGERCVTSSAFALAAETWAAMAALTEGSHRARCTHVAFHWLDRCPGFRSPLFAGLERPLSDRQHEIAALAARGSSSRDIATQLHLSVRTVDNHLRRIYAVLGIGGRTELAPLYPVGMPTNPVQTL